MEEKIEELYVNIQNYRFAQKYLKDIDIIYTYMVNYNRKQAENCASFYLQKYYKTLSKLGRITGGIRLVYNNNIYKAKSDDDIIDDLYFCILGVFCEAYIYIGFAKNVNDFVLNYLNK